MNTTHVKLGTTVTDTVTGIVGTLTHLYIALDGQKLYSLRPEGHIKKTGKLRNSFWITPQRIDSDYPMVNSAHIPTELIGTVVKHTESGIKGTVIGLTVHKNGCVHADVQPEGATDDGEALPFLDCDTRELEGKAVAKQTAAERDASLKAAPSPCFAPARTR